MILKLFIIVLLTLQFNQLQSQSNNEATLLYTWENGQKIAIKGRYPSISGDGNILIFSGKYADCQGFCHYYIKLLPDSTWTYPELIVQISNIKSIWQITPLSQFHDAFLSYSSNQIYFTSVDNSSLGQLQYDIFYINDIDGKTINKLPNTINTSIEDRFPSLTTDNQTMYFFRRHGTVGKIYVAQKNNDSTWGQPKALPPMINKGTLESWCRILPDNKTLVFSSMRNGGKGGLDLYTTELQEGGTWSEPINLSFINTKDYDTHLTMPLSGDIAYSNRYDSKKKEVFLYKIMIPMEFQRGKLYLKDDKIIDKRTGQSFELKDFIFSVNSYELNKNAILELNYLVEFLKKETSIQIEISAHTDNIGAEDTNQKLSQKRTESVVNYLIAKGIDKSRLIAKGYGESMPKVPNDTPQNRALNRRVEFRVIPQ